MTAIEWKRRKHGGDLFPSWTGKIADDPKVRFRVFYQPRNKIWAVDRMTYKEGRGNFSYGARTERVGYADTDDDAKDIAMAMLLLIGE